MARIAAIGFGYWGKNLVRNFHELGVLRLICDSESTREQIARTQYPDARFTTSIESVLSDDEIDAVVIATPAITHFELVKAALKADKDVFVEKPLALAVDQGEQLVDLAARRGRILMVGHILQYHPAVRKLKELVQSGELGRIEYLYSNRLNIGKFRTEENILWSFAPHDISVMLELLGEQPIHTVCGGGDYLNHDVADVTMSQFVFPSGARAHIFVSWLHPFKEQRLVVVGSQKMAVFEDTADHKLMLYPHQVQWVNRVPTAVKADAQTVPVPGIEPLRAECLQFLECIESRTQPITDGREGLRVLRVLDDCQRALTLAKPASTSQVKQPTELPYMAHATACIDGGEIGEGTKIWHYTHVMAGTKIGKDCSIGQNCCISQQTTIGDRVKIQNNVSIYSGTQIDDEVFLGPSCVLTNVSNPRSQINRHSLYEKTILRRGATIGANATILCGIEIGRYAFVAAGAVVTTSVPDYALVMGNPAKQRGWMSRHGHKLLNPDSDGIMICPESGYRYQLIAHNQLRCLDLDEETPLPQNLRTGTRDYRSFKNAPNEDLNPEVIAVTDLPNP